MALNEADTRSKLIDPALHTRGWTEDLIRREETAGAIEIMEGKTNLVFFTKGRPTKRIWYYDLSDVKVGKRTSFTLAQLEEFFRFLPTRPDSERSWTVTRDEVEAKNLDLKAVNPNTKSHEDVRSPAELIDLIEAKGKEIADALAELRRLNSGV